MACLCGLSWHIMAMVGEFTHRDTSHAEALLIIPFCKIESPSVNAYNLHAVLSSIVVVRLVATAHVAIVGDRASVRPKETTFLLTVGYPQPGVLEACQTGHAEVLLT